MTLETIFQNVTEGNMAEVESGVQAALDSGIAAEDILNKALIAAMDDVGRRFEAGDFFVPEMLVAASCSKNFALYRDRTGCAMVISADERAQVAAEANLKTLMHITISMPPDHGAAIVRTILSDNELRGVWEAELTEGRYDFLPVSQYRR